MYYTYQRKFSALAGLVVLSSVCSNAAADSCGRLASQGLTHGSLKAALDVVVPDGNGPTGPNGGLDFPMWLTLVDGSGRVCAVVNSLAPGQSVTKDIWLASRVISAQKATTANSLSTGLLALSTANLFAAVQPGGSLFGLQHSNPVDATIAYKGNAATFGTAGDPLVGKRIGGVNVFGGGFALYNGNHVKVGAIGVSGDTSCTDHVVAFKVRDAIGFDAVPAFGAFDKMFQDIVSGVSASGFGHPTCLNNPTDANDGGSIIGNPT